ncbi:MAG: CopD family protein [Rhizomicrobium sp.]
MTLFALVRALHFASLMTVFGANVFLWRAREAGLTGKRQRNLIHLSALIALVTACLWIGFVASEMGDVYVPGLNLLADVASKSYFGKVALWRFLLLLALCDSWFTPDLPGLRALVAGAALAMLGLTSHAAAAGGSEQFYLRAGVDAVHLLTAGFWTGGLVVLIFEVFAKPRDVPRLVALLRLFSRWGAVSVALLIVAGALNGVFILDAPMPWSGPYVTWLAVKIVLAAAMVALALTNRFGVLPALARGDKEAEYTIPLTVAAELACAMLILLIVGFLGVMPPTQM